MKKKAFAKLLYTVFAIILLVLISVPLITYLKASILRIAITIPGPTVPPFSLSHIEFLLGNEYSYHEDYSILLDLKVDGSLYGIEGFRRVDNDLTKKIYMPLCKKIYKTKLSETELTEIINIAEQVLNTENVFFDSYDVRYMYLLFKDELIISTYIGSNNTCIYSIINSLISYYPYDLALSFSSTKS